MGDEENCDLGQNNRNHAVPNFLSKVHIVLPVREADYVVHNDNNGDFFKDFSLISTITLERHSVPNHDDSGDACLSQHEKLQSKVLGEEDDEHWHQYTSVKEEDRL